MRHGSILGYMTNASDARGRIHEWTRGDRLRAAREYMAGSPNQREFATLLGVGRTTVIRYEADEPGADKPIVLIRWADVTGYDLDWLRHGIKPGGPPPSDTSPVTLGQAATIPLPIAA